MPDHAHIFAGFHPTIYIPDFVKEINVNRNEFIVSKKWVGPQFAWQEGYGAFSYSRSHIDRVIKYILNKEKHHKKATFREEYTATLDKFEVSYQKRFLFDFNDSLYP